MAIGGSLSLPTLVQRITLDVSDARKAQLEMDGGWSAVEAGTARAGAALTKNVTLPLLAVGAASVIMAVQFEDKMTQIAALVGIPRKQLDEWEDDVRSLAVTHGQSAIAAADALYFITSAGIKGKDAIDALDVSLGAARIGLGDVGTIADAVTSAMNAYSKSGLTARQATDVLVAAIREGKVEASELAPVLGNILPLASAMGVSFDQVAGILAVFSRTGMGAAEGATSLQAVLSTLLKPSKEAAQVLDGVGLSMADLRKMAAGPEGLIGVMRLLEQTFRDDDEALSMVVPNVRAMRGVMNALAQEGSVVDGVMQGVTNSTGDYDKALAATAASGADQMRRAWAQIKDSLLGVGLVILPVVSDVAAGLGVIVGAFAELPEPVQQAVVVLGVFFAALGPMLSISSRAIGAARSLSTFITTAQSAGMQAAFVGRGMSAGAAGMAGFATSAGLLAAAAVIPLYALGAFGEISSGVSVELAENATKTKELRAQLAALASSQKHVNEQIDLYRVKGSTMTDTQIAMASSNSGLQSSVSLLSTKYKLLFEDFGKLAQRSPEAAQSFIDQAAAAGLPAGKLERLRTILGETATAQEAANRTTAAAAEKLVDEGRAAELTAGQVNALVAAEVARMNAQLAAEGSLLAVERAQINYDKTMADGTTSTLDRKEAELQLRQSWLGAAAAAGEKAAADAVGATEATKASAATQAQIQTLTYLAGTLSPGSPLRVELEAYIGRLAASEGTRTAHVTVEAGQAYAQMDELERRFVRLHQWDGVSIDIVTQIFAGIYGGTTPSGRQHGGDTRPHQAYLVGEAGPELLFMGGKPGWVMSNAQMRGMASSVRASAAVSSAADSNAARGGGAHTSTTSGGRALVLEQTNHIASLDPAEIARVTARETSWALRTMTGGEV